MATAIRLASASLVLLAASIGSAAAQQAAAPCSGTFCDIYYGYLGNKPAAEPVPPTPAQGTPLTVPSLGRMFSGPSPTSPAATPVPEERASSSYVQLGGGGLLGPGGALSGRTSPEQRCSGSLCDAYYGIVGAPPEPQAARPATVEAEASAPPPSEAKAARKRAVEFAVQQEKPRCAAAGKDPWQCYR